MERIESIIRDKLATRLDLIEPGLQLLDIEKYLPNPQGTRGFVDIFARDSNGKYVLIELKRSNASSREALHEVLKYLEALKSSLSARDSEIRVFVVSTEWKELLVPFSSFVKRTSFEVSGFSLEVDSENTPTSAISVQPIDLSEDRLFAPWHELNLYESQSSMELGIRNYEASCAAKGIENYVLLVMKPSEEFKKRPGRMHALMQALGETTGLKMKSPKQIAAALPQYKYVLYFACLQLSEDMCWHAIRHGTYGEDLEEFEYYAPNLNGKALLCVLHEKAYEADPAITRDDYEIGYASKFSKLLDGEGSEIKEIRRYGTLKANNFLSDESIIEDLRGADGNRPQKYHKEFSPSNRAELAEVRSSVQRCLQDNPLWRAQIIRVLDDFLPKGSNLKATIHIYNPGNLCLSLYHSTTQKSLDYLPGYALLIEERDKPSCVILGKMWPTGRTPSFTRLLDDYYNGSGLLFLSNLSWGGYESRDVQISKDLGMTYKTFKIEVTEASRGFWELTDIGWEKCAPFDNMSGFNEFIKNNENFILDICDYYSTHWDGVVFQHDRDEKFLFRT